jgi:Carbohydrate family 9 binding domain-like
MRFVMRSGRYRRAGGLFGIAAGVVLLGASCVEQDEDKPTEEDMKAVKTNILTTAPSPQFAVNADLEGKVVYLGMDADPATAVPGKELKLTHYWKMVASPGDGWRVFTHIEGPNHQNFINADHGPVGGKYAVNQWKPGEIIRDQHTITLPATWNHESVMVYTGLWRGPTRLAVKSGPNDGANRVVAATIPVKVVAKPENARKRYVARRALKPIKVDGKLDEQAWKDAPSTGSFVNTMNGGPVEQNTEAKLLWDDKFLYVAFENADADVWSNLTKRDDKLWTQEADELMIDADKDGKTYVEIQVAPNGNVFDSYLPQYRKYEDTLDPKKQPYSWNSKINVKVDVQGSLNKHDDKDKGWTVELALPLGEVKGMEPKQEMPKLPPSVGDVWRINMFRMDVPQGKAQQASGWSPPMVGDFHALDRFGDLVFGDEKGNAVPPAPIAIAAADKTDKKSGKGERGSAKTAEKHAAHGKHKGEDKAAEKVDK